MRKYRKSHNILTPIFLVITVICIIGLVVGLYFGLRKHSSDSPVPECKKEGLGCSGTNCCSGFSCIGGYCQRIQWYPDSSGKFSPTIHDVKAFQDNLGSIVAPSPWKFSPVISPTPICDGNSDRLMLADYLARIYNGTKRDDILRLTLQQLESFISTLEWIYIVPNMPAKVAAYFNSKRRVSQGEIADFCKGITGDCDSSSGGICQAAEHYRSSGGTGGCIPSTKQPQIGLATNQQWSTDMGTTPIGVVTSNWEADRNQAYLFQTQMRKGSGSYGTCGDINNPSTCGAWWGNWIFTDPTRVSMRRGMMNSPQNDPKFYDVSFGYGGIPCNVLFEGGIMPIDSAFAPPGSIHGPLKVPNTCNPTFNKTCVLSTTARKNPAIYSYLLPGSGMFFESGLCGYMYNFVDGMLNIPPKCYDDKTTTWDGSIYSDVLTQRLPNGMPDYVAGVSKILIYLARKVFYSQKAVTAAQTQAATHKLTGKALSMWQAFNAMGAPAKVTAMDIRLPTDANQYLKATHVEPRFQKGGLGLAGLVDPIDTQAPPRAYTGARALHGQVAALMGVYQDTPPGVTKMNYSKTMSAGEFFGKGLFTKDGNTKQANCLFVDKRKYAMGWINGRWYGYPPNDKYNYSSGLGNMNPNYPNISECESKIGAAYVGTSKVNYTNGGIFTKGGQKGTPGKQESWVNEKWQGGYFMPTQNNPLVYYGMKDPVTGKKEVLYKTWYGKPIQMSYVTACKMIGMFYSQGDCGWEEAPVCWPFGSYFAYAEDLGIGKYAIGGQLLKMYNANSLHYTMTSTSLAKGALVSPAYDYEIVLTLPDKRVQSLACFCKTYMKSVNLFYNNGKHLQDYTNAAKGALGGWFPEEAGVEYNGGKGLSNFTTLLDGPAYAEYKNPVNDGIFPIDPHCTKTDAKSGCLFASFQPSLKNQVTDMSNQLVATKANTCKKILPN